MLLEASQSELDGPGCFELFRGDRDGDRLFLRDEDLEFFRGDRDGDRLFLRDDCKLGASEDRFGPTGTGATPTDLADGVSAEARWAVAYERRVVAPRARDIVS